jgi:lon-related putative ATP-dependent protease
MAVEPIPVDLLYRNCDEKQFPFETTADLQDPPGLAGQERVLAALRFGVGIRRKGYNLFMLGPDGLGKHDAVQRFLAETAHRERAPSDWAYVNNFSAPGKPTALELTPGTGRLLKEGMKRLIEELRLTIPALFESEEYQNRKQVIDEEFREKQETAFEGLRTKAEVEHIALLRTPSGFAFAPAHEGEVLKPEEFNKLSEDERKHIETTIQALQKDLAEIIERVPAREKEYRNALQKLNREVAAGAVERSSRDLRKLFEPNQKAFDWIDKAATDIVQNIEFFVAPAEANAQMSPDPFRRFEVNVIVDNRSGTSAAIKGSYIGGGAPIIYEDHPTLANLIGRVEHVPQMGALVTDFTLIKGGSLHRANGGYLLLDALKVLREPLAWDALKRAIRRSSIVIESPGEFLNLVSTVTLEPDPIPLDLKIVLFGDRYLYHMLAGADPDFPELFKVAADFDDEMDRDGENDFLYARLLAQVCRTEEMLPLDRSGVARMIERSSRLADDAEKLTTIMQPIRDLLHEADYIARSRSAAAISSDHIDAAVEAQIERADRVRERMLEMITRDIVMVDTEGDKIGQINGLSVLSLGAISFGRPSRITARVRMGLGGSRVVDIEREVDLGGPIHSKGVLILSGYLSAQFLPEIPMSMSASLVFEQSYGGIDGDSASSAELYALISALAEAPIAQGFAVTGSVNQLGEVQAIGGVNEKIEGFFDICQRRGLTGDQGVLIPSANMKHLMLRKDVIDALERGMFAVYPIEHVEQGIELLTGLPAGQRGADGKFPERTVFARAEARLAAFADNQRRFAQRIDDSPRR